MRTGSSGRLRVEVRYALAFLPCMDGLLRLMMTFFLVDSLEHLLIAT